MTAPIPTDSNFQPTWQPASWDAYESIRDLPDLDPRLFFHRGYLLIDRIPQSLNCVRINDLFPSLFFQWFTRRDQSFNAYRRCHLEKPNQQAACPDQVVYIGDPAVQWKRDRQTTLNLNQHRTPDLIVEVLDDVLISDLGKKKLYSALGLKEYWVIDLGSLRASIVQLSTDGRYYPTEISAALLGLPVAVLEGALIHTLEEGNQGANRWLQEQIAKYA